MSDSVRPHRWQPTRLPRPWDSPGKNTGVGCHFPLQCMKVKSESEVSQSCLTFSDPMDCSPPGSSVHGIFIRLNRSCFCTSLTFFPQAFASAVLFAWNSFHCPTCSPFSFLLKSCDDLRSISKAKVPVSPSVAATGSCA